MKKKWLIFSIAFLGCFVLCCFLLIRINSKKQIQRSYLCIEGAYFEPVKITNFSSRIPCVDISIGGKAIAAKVDLGFNGDISLPRECIAELDDKSFFHRASHFGIRGKKYYSDIYKIPEIKIGRMVFFRAKAQEINLEFEEDATILKDEQSPSIGHLGRIGWRLFHNFNCFIDCDNSLIAFCDSTNTLREKGYPVDAFIETSLLLDRNSVEFEATTETGLMRCILDTGSTGSMFNKDMQEGFNHMIYNPSTIDQHEPLNPLNIDQMQFDMEDICNVSIFKIGGKDFGPVRFQKMKSPLEIEAIIGMDFLESKLVFIDFPNRKIYFYQKPLTDDSNTKQS